MDCSDMIDIFKNESDICTRILECWETLREIQRTLKPLYQATVVMQKTDFTMSDFYVTWLQIEDKLRKLERHQGGRLASVMIEGLSNRKNQLIENRAMLAALALDPRFCTDLSEDKKKLATDVLIDLCKKIKTIENSGDDITESHEIESSDDEDISLASTRNLNYFMSRKKSEKNPRNAPITVFQLSDKIMTFMSSDHDVADESILDFWGKNQTKYPEISLLAEIIFG